jgi:hypothetical protein
MGRRRVHEVSADRARSFAALKDWPDEALAYMLDVFERRRLGAGGTLAELLADLKAKFNVEWNDSSLSRYYGFWEGRLRVERVAHEEAVALAEDFRRNASGDSKDLHEQLLESQRLRVLSNPLADPAEIVAMVLANDRMKLASDRLDWQKQQAVGARQIAEEKLKLDIELTDLERRKVELREKAAQITERVEEKAKAMGKTLDPEVARMIREEVYGLPA